MLTTAIETDIASLYKKNTAVHLHKSNCKTKIDKFTHTTKIVVGGMDDNL